MECKKLKTGNMKNEARPHRRLVYTWHCSKKCEKLQHFSSLCCRHEDCTAVLCICWRSTVHSVISVAQQCHKCLPRGPVRSISMRGAFCCFLPRDMRFFETSKNKKQLGVRMSLSAATADQPYLEFGSSSERTTKRVIWGAGIAPAWLSHVVYKNRWVLSRSDAMVRY